MNRKMDKSHKLDLALFSWSLTLCINFKWFAMICLRGTWVFELKPNAGCRKCMDRHGLNLFSPMPCGGAYTVHINIIDFWSKNKCVDINQFHFRVLISNHSFLKRIDIYNFCKQMKKYLIFHKFKYCNSVWNSLLFYILYTIDEVGGEQRKA